MSRPHFGHAHGLPVHLRTADHRRGGVNKKIGLLITTVVGTMICAYVFALVAFISLPSAVKSHNLTIIIGWISSNFIQLVLLPIIIVGQNAQAEASDARAAKTFTDTETILDRVDTATEGGITEILDAVKALDARLK